MFLLKGIPEGKVFIIDPNSEIRMPQRAHGYRKSYTEMGKGMLGSNQILSEFMFPPITDVAWLDMEREYAHRERLRQEREGIAENVRKELLAGTGQGNDEIEIEFSSASPKSKRKRTSPSEDEIGIEPSSPKSPSTTTASVSSPKATIKSNNSVNSASPKSSLLREEASKSMRGSTSRYASRQHDDEEFNDFNFWRTAPKLIRSDSEDDNEEDEDDNLSDDFISSDESSDF